LDTTSGKRDHFTLHPSRRRIRDECNPRTANPLPFDPGTCPPRLRVAVAATPIVIIDLRCRLTVAGAADYYADRVTRAHGSNRIPALAEGSLDHFFAEIAAAGITTAVSVSGRNPGARLGKHDLPARTTSNDQLADVQQRYPGRFIGIAGIDASNTFHDALTEIERCVTTLRLKAVVIEPGRAPGCLLNDERLYPIYEKCQSLDVPIIPQTSGALGGRLVDYANPKYIEQVADDFPRLNIICGHGCYPFVREAIVMAARRDNVWLSPDAYVFHLGRDDWLQAVNSNLMGFADRFLFASSYPLTPVKAFVDNFLKLPWNDEVLGRILYRNALQALRLDRDPLYRRMYGLD
jgi:predicted TIM-barrel fold metal-dependent hydrolase